MKFNWTRLTVIFSGKLIFFHEQNQRPQMKACNCNLPAKVLKTWGSSSWGLQLYGQRSEASARGLRPGLQTFEFLPMNYWTLLRTYQIQILYLLSGILSNFSTDFLNVQVSQIHDYYARGISTNFCYWGTAWKWIFPDTSLICLIQILKSVSLWPSSNALLTY